METISTIRILPATREERVAYIKNVIEEINSLNDSEFFDIYCQMKIATETFDNIINNDNVRDRLIDRAEINKIKSRFGEISISSRKTYRYDTCQLWVNIDIEIKQLEARKKTLEGQMKALRGEVADVETGEIISPAYLSKEIQVITTKTI